jgi:hypothetical protein
MVFYVNQKWNKTLRNQEKEDRRNGTKRDYTERELPFFPMLPMSGHDQSCQQLCELITHCDPHYRGKGRRSRTNCLKLHSQEMMQLEHEPRPSCFQTLSRKSVSLAPTYAIDDIQLIENCLIPKKKRGSTRWKRHVFRKRDRVHYAIH